MELHPDLFQTLLDPEDLEEDEYLSKVPSRYKDLVKDDPTMGKNHRPVFQGWE